MTQKILYFLRHANASPAQMGEQDHKRPLSGRGIKDAHAMGSKLAETGVKPQLVYCSCAAATFGLLAHIIGAVAA